VFVVLVLLVAFHLYSFEILVYQLVIILASKRNLDFMNLIHKSFSVSWFLFWNFAVLAWPSLNYKLETISKNVSLFCLLVLFWFFLGMQSFVGSPTRRTTLSSLTPHFSLPDLVSFTFSLWTFLAYWTIN